MLFNKKKKESESKLKSSYNEIKDTRILESPLVISSISEKNREIENQSSRIKNCGCFSIKKKKESESKLKNSYSEIKDPRIHEQSQNLRLNPQQSLKINKPQISGNSGTKPGKINNLKVDNRPLPNCYPKIKDHREIRRLKEYNLTVELTELTKKVCSRIYTNKVFIGDAIVYEKGIVLLPQNMTKIYEYKFYCVYMGSEYILELLTVVENTSVFKLSNFEKQGLNFSSIAKISDKMVTKIGSMQIELNKVEDKKLTYNCRENIDKKYVGSTFCIDEKPCFIIISIVIISYHCEIKVLPLDQASNYLQRPSPPPSLPYEGLTVDLYDKSRQKVSEVFQYKDYYFSYKNTSINYKGEFYVKNGTNYVPIELKSESYFCVFKSNQVYSKGLDKFEKNNAEKKCKMFTNNGHVIFNQSKSKSNIFYCKVKITLTTVYVGTLLFGSNQQPFAIITCIESYYAVRICRFVDLPLIFSNLNSSFYYYPITNSEIYEISSPENSIDLYPGIGAQSDSYNKINRSPSIHSIFTSSSDSSAKSSNSSIEIPPITIKLTVELTIVTEKFTSKVFVGSLCIGSVIVYQNGTVLLPKHLIKNHPGKYSCKYLRNMYYLELLTMLEETCVFKLDNINEPGLDFSNISNISDRMNINIDSRPIKLNKVENKKLTYNCSENIDDSFQGSTICIDNKPCFIIIKITITVMCQIKILPLKSVEKYLKKHTPDPLPASELPCQGFALDLYDNFHNKVSEVFQYGNYFFSYNNASINDKDEYLVKINSQYITLKIKSVSYFYIFTSDRGYSNGLDKFERNNFEPKGKVYTKNGPKDFIQSENNPSIYYSEEKIKITTIYVGTLLFGRNDQPFGIIICIESAYAVRILKLGDLDSLFSKIDKSLYYYPLDKEASLHQEKRVSNSISFNHSSSSSSSSFIRRVRPAPLLESGPETPVSITVSLNTTFFQEPEEFSYVLMGSELLKCSSRHYSPKIIKSPINYDEKSSYTTTSEGLLAVSGKNAHLIKDAELIELCPLSTVHHFHGSVVHDQKLFIISGEGTQVVEFLDLKNLNENWKEVMNLPQIREKPASCSSGDSIYVLGGEFYGSVTGTVFKFTSKWETLKWTVPEAMGMGAIFTNNSLVLFGGKGNIAYKDFYYTYSTDGEQLSTKDFPVQGLFHNKAVGRNGDVFLILQSKTQSLEYENDFKLVCTTLS